MEKCKKSIGKVLKWMAIVVAVLVAGGFVLSRVANHKLHAALAGFPGARIEFRKVNLSPILGNLEFRDVAFSLRDTAGIGPDIDGRIEAIRLERLHWLSFIHGEARAERLLIREPEARLVLTGKTAEEKDSTEQAPPASFLKRIALSEVCVEKGKIGLDSRADSTMVAAEGISFSLRDIGIQLPEGLLEYNDSSYFVALDSLDYRDAAGLSRIQAAHLATADAGPVEALEMHLYNCVPMEEVAERMGKVSAMWYDVSLDSLYTSPLNIPRMVKEQRIEIDSVRLCGPEIVLFQDDRYPPAVPYPTLQEGLNTLEWPLHIGRIDAGIESFTFIWETTHINRGLFPLHDLRLSVSSVGNAPDNVMVMGIKSGNEQYGRLGLSVQVHNDKRETTRGKMQIYGLDAARLDSFVRPLFGATAKADIHQIDCTFQGDKNKMTTDFCMLYENLSLQAWNDKTAPFRLVSKNSGVVSFLANIVAPNANPSRPGKDPKKVEFTFERDPMLPYPSYIIQNLTMGMLHTILPGGSVRKAKDNKKK